MYHQLPDNESDEDSERYSLLSGGQPTAYGTFTDESPEIESENSVPLRQSQQHLRSYQSLDTDPQLWRRNPRKRHGLTIDEPYYTNTPWTPISSGIDRAMQTIGVYKPWPEDDPFDSDTDIEDIVPPEPDYFRRRRVGRVAMDDPYHTQVPYTSLSSSLDKTLAFLTRRRNPPKHPEYVSDADLESFLPPKDLRLMQKFGYRFGKELGSGGFGVVRECWYHHDFVDDQNPQYVKIEITTLVCKKVLTRLRPNQTVDDFIGFLNAEKVALMCAKHINVIDIHNIWTQYQSMDSPPSYTLFFMERADGDLIDYLEANRKANNQPLEEEYARHWFRQILSGVEYLHSIHIAHRDLKPENVLYVRRPASFPFVAKLTDFGYAHIARQSNPNESLHRFAGTVGFAAPEVMACLTTASNSYDPFKADIYSLGCTLKFMLTLKQFNMYVRGAQQFYPTSRNVFVSPEVYDLIDQMTAAYPDYRFSLSQIRNHRWLTSVTRGRFSVAPVV